MEKSSLLICFSHLFIEIFYLVPFALVPVVAVEFHLSLVEASLLISVPGFLGLLANIPAGFLADRVRVNRLLFFGLLLEGAAMLLISQTNSFLALLLFSSLMRIALPFYHAPGLGCLARITKKEHMNRLAGFHNAFGNVGQAIGVITLGICLLTIGWRWAYLILALPTLIWSYLVLVSLRVDKDEDTSIQATDSKTSVESPSAFPSLFKILVVIAIMQMGTVGAMTFLTSYFVNVRSLSTSVASLLFGIGPFIGVAGSLVGGNFGHRAGSKKALVYILLICTVFLLAVSVAGQIYFLLLAYGIYSLFASSSWAPINALVAESSPPKSKGLGFSLSSMVDGIVTTLAPVVVAAIVEFTHNLWYAFPSSAAFLLASVLILQFFYKKRNVVLKV